MKSLLIIFVAWIMFLPGSDISMLGIKINDTKNSLDKVKLKVIAKEEGMVKFKPENGNELSITIENGKIVYMENDWLQDERNTQPLYSDFSFGKTTLRDIRNKFGTNGFAYASRRAVTTETDLIEFNCFEFDSPNNEVLVMITKVSVKEKVTNENIADKLKLDALIIAEKKYLDAAWGTDKTLDTNYKKIKP